MNKIEQTLNGLFEKHRIIFWYDAKREMRADFDALELDGVMKAEIRNNEFGLKHRILREEPDQRFLLYFEGPQPADLHNWLLDVQLAHGEFRADQTSLWLAELGLGIEFAELAEAHSEFFRAARRREDLGLIMKATDSLAQIRLKMLAVCVGSEPQLDSILEALLTEMAAAKDDKIRLIGRCGLDSFLWKQMANVYDYNSVTPGIKDFLLTLFKYAYGDQDAVKLNNDALIFLKRWKDSRSSAKSFEDLSAECAGILDIKTSILKRDFNDLMDLDVFKLIDARIVQDLIGGVVQRTIPASDIERYVRQRSQSYWYKDYENLYEAVSQAAQFLQLIELGQFEMESLADGVKRYCASWYKLDQLYRKYVFHMRSSGQVSNLEPLTTLIENNYANRYLLKLNDVWQEQVDNAAKWDAENLLDSEVIHSQNRFFTRWVSPFLDKGLKVCVIISDALRYEIGEELLSLVRQEDRFNAALKPMLAMLPSYTQLGMAALLPNKELSLATDDSGSVLVNGQSTQGLESRKKILTQIAGKKATAFKADELMNMNRDDLRGIIREHDLIYVYHNLIDQLGDKRETEERVFEGVNDSLEELLRLIKKLTGNNVNNLLVTSDHGFIYQNRSIDESDFTVMDAEGDSIQYRNRRFVLGRGLTDNISLRKFTSAELGLVGDVEVQIPKSINRLRVKGSGSRYVHGGASLQEVVVPVVWINKKRQSDIANVEVEILPGGSRIITSNMLNVGFYQVQPVSDKIKARTLQAAIFARDGQQISESHELVFNLASENSREREIRQSFLLTSNSGAYNDQEVTLRLQETVEGTSHYTVYKSECYKLLTRIMRDEFDF